MEEAARTVEVMEAGRVSVVTVEICWARAVAMRVVRMVMRRGREGVVGERGIFVVVVDGVLGGLWDIILGLDVQAHRTQGYSRIDDAAWFSLQ